MDISQTTLLCFSPTGTTKTILTALGEGLGTPSRLLDMTLPHARIEKVTFTTSELLVIGFPVYAGRLPGIQAQIFDLLPESDIPVVPVVVYGNRDYDDALLELADLCRAKGYTLAGAASFIGQHSFSPALGAGRPNQDDKERARQFGSDLLKTLRDDKHLDITTIPGKRPYKEVPVSPRVPASNADVCTQCLLCVDRCPTGAIDPKTPCQTDSQRCILCAACVYACPTGARGIPAPIQAHMVEIAKNNATPKQPAIFLPKTF